MIDALQGRTERQECEAVCPKEIKMVNIALMNRDFLKATWVAPERVAAAGGA